MTLTRNFKQTIVERVERDDGVADQTVVEFHRLSSNCSSFGAWRPSSQRSERGGFLPLGLGFASTAALSSNAPATVPVGCAPSCHHPAASSTTRGKSGRPSATWPPGRWRRGRPARPCNAVNTMRADRNSNRLRAAAEALGSGSR